MLGAYFLNSIEQNFLQNMKYNCSQRLMLFRTSYIHVSKSKSVKKNLPFDCPLYN